MMHRVLDRSGGTKLYIQLADLIREQIKAGSFQEGQLLPTEDNLCKSYSVSKAVVRQAMMELAREGWVVKRQGIGTFASKPKIAEGPVMICPLTDRVLDFGIPVDTQVVYKGASAVPSDMLPLFSGEIPEQLFKLVRLRKLKGQAILLETAYILSDLCPGLALDDLKNQSLFELIGKRYNLRIERVACSFDLTPLAERESQLLNVPAGKMAILFDQILYLQGERVLGLIRSFCPVGKHRISYELARKE